MRKMILIVFDAVVYGGFGLFLVAQVFAMPNALKERLLSESWKFISRMIS